MSFTGVFGLIILAIVALALLGPAKLPRGIEQLWLMITNLRRSQSELEPLTIEHARRIWDASDSPFYHLIQIMYGAVEHLLELRRRIFYVLITVVAGAVVAAVFVERIMILLKLPAKDLSLVALRPTDLIWTYMEVIFSAAAIVALPMLIVQILLFIRPALESPFEMRVFRTIAIIGMPMVVAFFLGGLAFAYFVLLPSMLPFLQSFGRSVAEPLWSVREYLSFVLTVMLWIGAAFETPLLMTLLSRLGLVSPRTMAKQWRYAIVGGAIVAAAITPTVDPVNMAMVMAPLLGLYFLGVLMARAVWRPRNDAPTGA